MAAAMIGAVALTGCSDGDSGSSGHDAVVTSTDVAVSPSNLTAAKSFASSLAGTSVFLDGDALGTVVNADGSTATFSIPGSTTLTFVAATSTATNVITGFTLESPTDLAEGDIEVGSCKMKVKAVKKGNKYAVGKTYVFEPCSFSLVSNGEKLNLTSDVVTNVTIKVKLGEKTFKKDVQVTVTTGGKILLNGKEIGKATFATGSTGSGNT